MKVCSTTFLSLSWPKLLSGKYWFSWFSGWFSWYSKTVNRFLDQLSRTLSRFSVWWKLVQPVLKPVQPVFALFTFFCQSTMSAKKLCAAFWKPVQPVLGPGQPVYVQKSKKRLVLEPHLYIYSLLPLSPTGEHDLDSISNMRDTSHSLSHTSCLSHFKSLEKKSLSEFESCGFCASSPNLSCSSWFKLWYYIELFVDSLLLELLAPRRLGVSC